MMISCSKQHREKEEREREGEMNKEAFFVLVPNAPYLSPCTYVQYTKPRLIVHINVCTENIPLIAAILIIMVFSLLFAIKDF